MKTDELREKYLAFFEEKGCVRRPSDVLVPRWDPSVLFTPAGMNQFKDHFLGKCKLDFTRATTCQKCLRTGDIDNVGRTAYHHTFFEMLGNFSFGDYFKREAIHWAWEFLTQKKWLGLPQEKLSVTVYLDDDEAFNIWNQEIKLPANRIRRLGEHDNFWPAGAPTDGPDGVCGPCSEIFYHPTPDSEVEIWNLVFTQFNREGNPPNNLHPLPSKNIDTGMGLERTASVLQNVETNFHIDILRPLVEAAAEICKVHYEPASENGRRLRRIADHIRACTFAVHENVYPGNNKEKYVVKRLLRRAVLDGRQLGCEDAFLHQLVPTVAQLMHSAYPELSETTNRVAKVIQQEEQNFFSKIDAGLDRIDRLFATLKKENLSIISGADAAEMYTTHGFPPELLETIAVEHNFGFDWDGFRQEMEQHGIDSGGGVRAELFSKSTPLDTLKTSLPSTEFLGYELNESSASIVGLISHDKLCEEIEEVDHQTPVIVILDKTPFYGESGGQIGDIGEIWNDDFRFEVTNTQKDSGFVLHFGHLKHGKLSLDAHVQAKVHSERRQGIQRAHSATHVLHYALQKHLGTHAQQQGSKVDDDLLRFDFSNPSSLTPEELREIESDVNHRVISAQQVSWTSLPIDDARKAGAMMLFGEKYPDIVRMVSIGDFSKELCGGTHLSNTGEIGLFKIVNEESVSAGVRRITAVTGKAALDYVRKAENTLFELTSLLKAAPHELVTRVTNLSKEVRELKKQLASNSGKSAVSIEQLLASAKQIASTQVIVAETAGVDANGMRQIIDQIRRKVGSSAVLLADRSDDKVTLVAGISRDLEDKGLHAGKWINSAAVAVGGRGGGRADLAQAGGKDPAKLPSALESASSIIIEQLEALPV